MKFQKKTLSSFKSPYSICVAENRDQLFIFAGSEAINGELFLYRGGDYEPHKIIEGPGGFMSILSPHIFNAPLIIAAEGLHPTFQSIHAGISIYSPDQNIYNPWKRHRIADLAYIHRIAFVSTNEKKSIVASSLCEKKDDIDDWSTPGAVYEIIIQNDDLTVRQEKKLILSGITKNHGMYVQNKDNRDTIFLSGEEGIFSLSIDARNDKWIVDNIIDQPVSELVVEDLDEDGEEEIVTIQPFHGNWLRIYKKIVGKWEIVCEKSIDFGHGIWAGRFGGKFGVVLGTRAGKKDLCFYAIEGSWKLQKTIIDEGTGTAQIDVVKSAHRDLIIASNNHIDEVALYEITD